MRWNTTFTYSKAKRIRQSYYIGTTGDLSQRIERHNQGRSKYTKHKRPWNLVYVEDHPDRSSAMRTISIIE